MTNLKFYARPGGTHFHSNLQCLALGLGYKEVSLRDAERRHLNVCPCVAKDLGFNKLPTIDEIQYRLKAYRKKKLFSKT